jgi:hypothetical protein
MAKVAMDRFNVNDLVDLLASMEDTVGRVTGVRDGGTRIRVLWQHRRGYEGYTTIHDSSALRKIPAAKYPGLPHGRRQPLTPEGGR